MLSNLSKIVLVLLVLLPSRSSHAAGDGGDLAIQTVIVFGLMGTTMAILRQLPAESTQWDDGADPEGRSLSEQYRDNIKAGPVWDNDLRFFNAYAHIHIGASYQVMCREIGYSDSACFIYANFLSLAWEYGPEAIKEVPSWQDILMTGPVGSRVGNIFYAWRQQIRKNGGRIFGSKTIGNLSNFLLDPIGSIARGVQNGVGLAGHFEIITPPVYALALKGDPKAQTYGVKYKIAF